MPEYSFFCTGVGVVQGAVRSIQDGTVFGVAHVQLAAAGNIRTVERGVGCRAAGNGDISAGVYGKFANALRALRPASLVGVGDGHVFCGGDAGTAPDGCTGAAAGHGHTAARVHGKGFAAHSAVCTGNGNITAAGDAGRAGDGLRTLFCAGDGGAGTGRYGQIIVDRWAVLAAQHHVHAGCREGERLVNGAGDGELMAGSAVFHACTGCAARGGK